MAAMRILLSFTRNWAFFIGIVLVWQLVTQAVRSPFFPTRSRSWTGSAGCC
ncbi:hypothetical protein [Kibdelosporangium philippinense]|uniref:hypothetical protein n=1 Tax=Kibdelosporangium philippinense TaxID=211113 RepID=UPI00361B6BE5